MSGSEDTRRNTAALGLVFLMLFLPILESITIAFGDCSVNDTGIECSTTATCQTITSTSTTTTTSTTSTTTTIEIPTCSDGIKNQGEEDIDCGGPCKPCKKEYPEITEDTIKYKFGGALLFAFFLLSMIVLITHYRNLKHKREYTIEEFRYEKIIDKILEERGFTS